MLIRLVEGNKLVNFALGGLGEISIKKGRYLLLKETGTRPSLVPLRLLI